ncbi:MAG: hypothetical protein BGN97_00035 [Microbacterium sp. 69-10]|nr:MAG: hypothetical protein BGN97_00035 [Microbacterium sp. 69-10]
MLGVDPNSQQLRLELAAEHPEQLADRAGVARTAALGREQYVVWIPFGVGNVARHEFAQYLHCELRHANPTLLPLRGSQILKPSCTTASEPRPSASRA